MNMTIHIAVILLMVNAMIVANGFHWPIFPSAYHHEWTEWDVDEKRGIPECSWCTYETKWFDQNVDHFNFVSNKTFKHHYLINKSQWKPGTPIFLYCGNEADIRYFTKSVGLIWEMAPDFKAMVIFAEQRYQGHSMPFGEKSLSGTRYTGYLSSSQVLADFAKLINFIKANISGAKESPVIAFGGSLGGQYAAWMRMKYPNIIAGSVASSAPLFQFSTNCETQYSLVTKAFSKDGGSACVVLIKKSWSALHRLGLKKDGKKFISKTFSLCQPIKKYKDLYKLRDKLALSYLFLAMENYPYNTASKPAWPIKAVCKSIKSSEGTDKKLIGDLAKGLSIYFNHSKSLKCLHLPRDGKEFLGAWNYQSCTEMAFPLCSDGVHDMYYRSPWDIKGMSKVCEATWGAKPEPSRISIQYGDRDITEHSNILFTNGDNDPWSGGGVLHNISDSLIAINIEHGAHTYDLRFTRPQDSPSVLAARKKAKYYVNEWIKKWHNKIRNLKLKAKYV